MIRLINNYIKLIFTKFFSLGRFFLSFLYFSINISSKIINFLNLVVFNIKKFFKLSISLIKFFFLSLLLYFFLFVDFFYKLFTYVYNLSLLSNFLIFLIEKIDSLNFQKLTKYLQKLSILLQLMSRLNFKIRLYLHNLHNLCNFIYNFVYNFIKNFYLGNFVKNFRLFIKKPDRIVFQKLFNFNFFVLVFFILKIFIDIIKLEFNFVCININLWVYKLYINFMSYKNNLKMIITFFITRNKVFIVKKIKRFLSYFNFVFAVCFYIKNVYFNFVDWIDDIDNEDGYYYSLIVTLEERVIAIFELILFVIECVFMCVLLLKIIIIELIKLIKIFLNFALNFALNFVLRSIVYIFMFFMFLIKTPFYLLLKIKNLVVLIVKLFLSLINLLILAPSYIISLCIKMFKLCNNIIKIIYNFVYKFICTSIYLLKIAPGVTKKYVKKLFWAYLEYLAKKNKGTVQDLISNLKDIRSFILNIFVSIYLYIYSGVEEVYKNWKKTRIDKVIFFMFILYVKWFSPKAFRFFKKLINYNFVYLNLKNSLKKNKITSFFFLFLLFFLIVKILKCVLFPKLFLSKSLDISLLVFKSYKNKFLKYFFFKQRKFNPLQFYFKKDWLFKSKDRYVSRNKFKFLKYYFFKNKVWLVRNKYTRWFLRKTRIQKVKYKFSEQIRKKIYMHPKKRRLINLFLKVIPLKILIVCIDVCYNPEFLLHVIGTLVEM